MKKQAMKRILTVLSTVLIAANISAQTSTEKSQSAPVKKWNLDILNYFIMVENDQETVFLGTRLALRYNLANLPVDVGGEFSMAGSPHAHYDMDENVQLDEGLALHKHYYMFSAIANYNFRKSRKISFYIGTDLGAGIGYKSFINKSYLGPEGTYIHESDDKYYFTASFTPRIGVEFSRIFRLGVKFRIDTDGCISIGPTFGFVIKL